LARVPSSPIVSRGITNSSLNLFQPQIGAGNGFTGKPFQICAGGLAIFLHKEAIEVQDAEEKYYLVSPPVTLSFE
jgi:hypothetical protein